MAAMFYIASKFNQPLSTWDTASVTDMTGLFYGASSFNQPLSSWNTTSVMNMTWSFYGASSFNQSLCAWAEQLPKTCTVMEAFEETACPFIATPSLSSVPLGPFCYSCGA
jgi:surface protein